MGGGGGDNQTVVVQQTATQTQEVNVNKDLQGTIDNLVGVLNEQAKNQKSPIVIPIIATTGTQTGETTGDDTQKPYSNAAVSQLLATMYYNVLKGQQEVESTDSPVNLTSIFIVAAVIIIAIFLWKGK